MAYRRHPFAVITLLGFLLSMVPAVANGQTVLVTGANSGIGLEFTKQYLARGWTVIATHRRSELPATLAELTKKYKTIR
ncbi:MAG TPA: SDR family NAD(P)-dependent oxidoreductase, partial [Vicinamibacterales bacterium]|nr:SDR family NAD(P)-dependent oxidoreductase [Vicinamibacterales bacterium]